jgi:hypothetical protein
MSRKVSPSLVAAAVNFISTRLVEYPANRWVSDAPSLVDRI